LQPLLTTLRYHGLKELAQSRTYEFVSVDPAYENAGTFASLRGNAVLRWEYLPGSSMYFVWTQERLNDDGASEFDMKQSMHLASHAPANTVFMVKVAPPFAL